MARLTRRGEDLRRYRNTRLYRSLTRVLRVYNRRVVEALHARGYTDFSPAFPALLSNLDLEGTRIGVLAARAGVTRQAAGQLLKEIESRGYVETQPSSDDARVTLVKFTSRGRQLFANIAELAEQIEDEFAAHAGMREFDAARVALSSIADRIDPGGALGVGDRPPKRRTRT